MSVLCVRIWNCAHIFPSKLIFIFTVYTFLQRRKFFQAGPFHLSANLNFIQIMTVLRLDGVLLTTKIVQLIAVKLAWTMLNVPKKVKKNAIFGFTARQNLDVIHQIFISTNIWNAGLNM